MPKVIVAPLDWGLGHATRCIPLIKAFLSQGWEVTLAGEGMVAQLLKASFPEIPLLTLPGYQIRYAKRNLKWKIIQQTPQILRSIRNEKQWLLQQYPQYRWDLIISDNRPGFYHAEAYNIYLTHQLHPQSGYGKPGDNLLSFIHRHFMKPFNEIWVPDIGDMINLSGKLSHPVKTKNVRYIGLLSRLQPTTSTQYVYDLLILLSGPEPQRSLLEKIILQQIGEEGKKILLIRGTTLPMPKDPVPKRVTIINLADHTTIQQAFSQAEKVICRSGYTTLMDLIRCNKKALLIPTPGQTEQEYLAERMSAQNWFPVLRQECFQLEEALRMLTETQSRFPHEEFNFNLYNSFIHSLKAAEKYQLRASESPSLYDKNKKLIEK
ncbi:MAG: glycosyltransferase [Bacteroidetes bacterium]|nr:glycosyltransferase [Bacteroidota bacterium]